jgi:hypothetical protein
VADEPFFDTFSSRKGLGEQALWLPLYHGQAVRFSGFTNR